MEPFNKVQQRANKLERLRVLEALKEIWAKAYETGEVTIKFSPGKEREARIFYQSLADYRKKIYRKKSQYYDIFIKIDAVQLTRPDDNTIRLIKKSNRLSNRSAIVLGVLESHAHLFKEQLTRTLPDLSDILADID